jgi:AraC-like DNA-binding protein
MFYQKFKLPPILQPFVECLYIWEGKVLPNDTHTFESPPNSFASIVFNYGDAYTVSNAQHSNLKTPPFFITGQATQRYQLALSGTIGMVGVVFKPAALATFFNLPMYELTEARLDLATVLGKPVQELGNRIAEAKHRGQRLQLVENWLLQLHREKAGNLDGIDVAANLILDRTGNVEVEELLREVFMSRRQFERKFFAKVGVSPKYYIRIRRIGQVCNLLAHQQKADWQLLIGAGGYFDQAHFIKEFKHFMGKTPSQYFKHNQELIHFLERE